MKERRGEPSSRRFERGSARACGSRARFRRHARRDVVFEDIGWHPYWSPQSPRSRRGGAVAGVELFELPRASADGTPLFRLRVEPLGDALQVEGVSALTHTTGLSSPGNLASGGHASKATRQMPHTSSLSPAFHVQTPTACHLRMFTTRPVLLSVAADIAPVTCAPRCARPRGSETRNSSSSTS